MTIQDAIAQIADYIDGYHVPADRAEALRLAMEALREKGEREANAERVKKARDRYRELARKFEDGDLTDEETVEMGECYLEGEME